MTKVKISNWGLVFYNNFGSLFISLSVRARFFSPLLFCFSRLRDARPARMALKAGANIQAADDSHDCPRPCAPRVRRWPS